MEHEHSLVDRYDIRATTLQHGDLSAILVEVLRNVMPAVPRADDNDLLSLNVVLGRILVLAAMVDHAFEVILARESQDLGFT